MSVSFNAYLDKTFDEQLLCVYGFKNKQLGRISEQHFLSCSGGP